MSDQDDDNWVAGWILVAVLAVTLGLVLTASVCSGKLAHGDVTRNGIETTLATGFAYPGDKWAGDQFFCLRKKIDATTPGVAHRWRKCGSRVTITNRRNGRKVTARIIDRGPYWLVPASCARDAVDKGGFRYASHKCWKRGRPATRRETIDALFRRPLPKGMVYANGLDMTPLIRRALMHNGKEPVDLVWR